MPNTRSCMALAVIALAPLLIYFASVAIAAPKHVELKTKYRYYEVRGSTAAELYSELVNYGPWVDEVWGTGQPGRVWVLIEILPKISKTCKCTEISVAFDIIKCKPRLGDFTLYSVITLPKWNPTANSNQALRSRWAQLITAMKKEAIRHRNIAHRTMKKIQRDLTSRDPGRSCKNYRRTIDKLFRNRGYEEGHKSQQGQIHKDSKFGVNKNPPVLKDHY